MNTRLHIPLALAALFLLGSTLCAAPRKAPNVVIILADELGYGDVGFNGGKQIPTPGLDRIAAGGVVARNAYLVHTASSGNRAGLLTGRYPQRFGLERPVGWRPQDPTAGLPASEKTLAEVLGPLGYKSSFIGKWHLGANDAFHPNNRGFNEFFGFLGAGHFSLPDSLTIQNTYEARTEPDSYRTWILRGFQPVPIKDYLTDEFTDEAIDFIRRHRSTPFLLVLSHAAPRSPLQAPENEIAAFAHIENERRRTYAAMVSVLDRGVGRILDELDALEIGDNTLLFFLSAASADTPNGGSTNGGLRGHRGHLYEGGIRTPFVVRWPGVIPGGTTFPRPVSLLDVFATATAAAGAKPDPARPIDGVNLVPHLRGEIDTPPHERIFVRNLDAGAYAMRDGNFKIIKANKTADPVVFNLAQDYAEKNNIADMDAARLQRLKDSLTEWNAQMIDPVIPGVNMEDWKGDR